jgi:hypothetical protein
MKKYNCPDCIIDDCMNFDICNHCKRNNQQNTSYYYIRHQYDTTADDPCLNCSNDPRNGGSGICYCTIGARKFY